MGFDHTWVIIIHFWTLNHSSFSERKGRDTQRYNIQVINFLIQPQMKTEVCQHIFA